MSDLENLQNQINLIRDMIISRTGAALEVSDVRGEELFMQWAYEFSANDRQCLRTFDELKPHLKFPI